MTMAETIEKEIRAMYQNGKTQQELANMFGLSQQYIQRLLSGSRQWSGISIGNVEKMFPNANLNLHGSTVSTATGTNATSIIGDNNHVHCDELKHRIISEVMSSDLDPAAKVKVYQIVEAIV